MHRTPVLTCRVARRGGRRATLLQVRELPEGRRVQGARRDQCGVLAARTPRRGAASSRIRRAITARRSPMRPAQRGIPAWVVMPENAPKVKQENVRRFGATIRFCAPNVAAREAACADGAGGDGRDARPSVRRRAGDRRTGDRGARAARGGAGSRRRHRAGGRRRACFRAPPSRRARCGRRSRVYGAEPANADDAARSFRSGRVEPLPATTTIADGLRTTLSRADARRAARTRRGDRDRERGGDRARRCG